MIAKKVIPKSGRRGSFSACINYANRDRTGRVWMRGLFAANTAAIEMIAVAKLNKRAWDAVRHLLLCYAVDERPTPEQIQADIERLLDRLDMADHQFYAREHTDTGKLHIHVIANRIGWDGKCAKSSFDYFIHETVCAEIAADRDWRIVDGRTNADIVHYLQGRQHVIPERRLTDGEYRHQQRTGDLPWQDRVRPLIIAAVAEADSWAKLAELLAHHGIVVRCKVNVRKSDGKKFPGLAFREGEGEDVPGCSASKISDACKYSSLAHRFGPWPDFAQEFLKAPEVSADQLDKHAAVAGRPATPSPTLVCPTTHAEDALVLQQQYQRHLYHLRGIRAIAQPRWADAWAQEKALRRQEKEERESAYLRRRSEAMKKERGLYRTMKLHENNFIAKWDRWADRNRASRRWCQGSRSIRPVMPTFQQYVARLAAKGDIIAQRHLVWLSRGTAKLEEAFAPYLGWGWPNTHVEVTNVRPAEKQEEAPPAANVIDASPPVLAVAEKPIAPRPPVFSAPPKAPPVARPIEAVHWDTARQSVAGRPGWSSPHHQSMMDTIVAYARQSMEKRLDTAIGQYRDEKVPASVRARAVVDAEVVHRQLHQDSVPPVLAWPAVRELLHWEFCGGTERQFCEETIDYNWMPTGLHREIADSVRAAIMPTAKYPELTKKAQQEWARMQGPRSILSAIAAVKRLATARAREEPRDAITILEACQDYFLSGLSADDWRSLQLRLPNEVKIAKLEADRNPTVYGKRAEIFAALSQRVIEEQRFEQPAISTTHHKESLR